MRKTTKIALCGIMSAVATVIMLISYFPYFTYAVPAVAGLSVMVVLLETDKKYALYTYLVSSVTVFLFAEIEAKVMYVCFFGCYPILKALFEGVKSRPVEYLLKFLSFNAAVGLVYCGLSGVFGIDVSEFKTYGAFAATGVLLLGNVAFFFYDIAISRSSLYYYKKIHPAVKKFLR